MGGLFRRAAYARLAGNEDANDTCLLTFDPDMRQCITLIEIMAFWRGVNDLIDCVLGRWRGVR